MVSATACSQKPQNSEVAVVNVEIKSALTDSIMLNKEMVTGKIEYKQDPDFILVDKEFSSKPIYLRKETYQAFKAMHAAAKADGIQLTIISGTRNFNEQKAIWDRKWEANRSSGKYKTDSANAKNILRFSSMPGTSRHHWGTDIDLNNLNNSYFASGKGKTEYDWLVANAGRFGFCQVYDDKQISARKGYEQEKWHWSYLPLATKYLAFYQKEITYQDISGFKGAEIAQKLNAIENYVWGISEKCK